jgi:hypothetical protein
MRIALLPSSGNPYVLGLWLRSFQRFWRDEVDKLYATVAVPIEQPVMEYVASELAAAGAIVVPIPGLHHSIEHGEAIAWLLEHCEDGVLLLIEEDCFVLGPGEIGSCFSRIEGGEFDIVASLRGPASDGLRTRAKQVFDLATEPFFAPNLFFARRSLLAGTDRHFSARRWDVGDRIEPVDLVCEQDECCDTFVWASLQLWPSNPRVFAIHQYHASLSDIADHRAGRGLFEKAPPWVHFGALAGGVHVMMDQEGMVIAYRELRAPGHMDDVTQLSAPDYEKKLAMWTLCREHFPIRDAAAAYYNSVFGYATANVIARRSDVIDQASISAFMSAYSALFAPLLG